LDLPKAGEKIPVERFHVSEMNVRYEDSFGESEEDLVLMDNLRRGRIIGPFKARPEGEGFGVVVGRRRFLAKKDAGATHFVVNKDCIIEEMSDEEAREASLVENLSILRKEMDPVTRAEALNEVISFSAVGLRGTARHLGISPSTLSEWLKVLELTPKMQKALSQGDIYYSDALQVARLKLGETLQDELAEVAEKEGVDAFKKALSRVPTGHMKRGIPRDVYAIVRMTFDKRSRNDKAVWEKLTKLAEKAEMKVDEYCKQVLKEHTAKA
jgi:ParB/RepB/Spo0J family partition protein